jgi:hypothetical protein
MICPSHLSQCRERISMTDVKLLWKPVQVAEAADRLHPWGWSS